MQVNASCCSHDKEDYETLASNETQITHRVHSHETLLLHSDEFPKWNGYTCSRIRALFLFIPVPRLHVHTPQQIFAPQYIRRLLCPTLVSVRIFNLSLTFLATYGLGWVGSEACFTNSTDVYCFFSHYYWGDFSLSTACVPVCAVIVLVN